MTFINWKYEAVDKLKGYEARKRALESIPAEMRRLELSFAGIRSASGDGTPVTGGGSMREDALLSNIARREELKRRFTEARLWVETVDKALAVLDEEERLVLDRFYIHREKKNIERLMEELDREKSAVYDRRDRALRHFTLALYGTVET